MKFCFPFRTAAGAEYSSADELFDLQKSEGSGHYLIGKNNFWHGGIHFTDKSIPHCKDREMIRCMADGEIVAYRLNSAYLQSLWQAQTLQYSTSFCLVRHRYESAAAAASNNDAPERNVLTFFTLYMHLAPFAIYAGNREPYRIKISAKDLRARDQASLDSTVLGTLNKNAELEVISLCEVKSGNSIYAFADAILRKGSANGVGDRKLAPGSRFWLAISKVTNSAQGSSKEMFAEFVRSEDARRPHWWPANNRVLVHSRVNARDKIGRDGSRLGLIAVGSELEYDAASVQTLTLDGRSRRFAECRLLSGGYSDRTAPPPARFWVCIDADFVAVQAGDPVGLDKVVTCNIPVKAGDPLGYMGLYETAKAGGDKKSKHQVHIELFSGDPNLQAFLENRAGVSQGEKFLKLSAGTALFACDTQTPPDFSETDIKLDSPFMAPFGTEKTLKDANDVEWLQVDLTDDGHCMNGFVRVDAGEIITRHDWLKMGFQTVRAKSASDSYLSKTVTSAFYQDLYKAVTGEPAPADRDNVRVALTGDENKEKWSKLIVKHPSEWKARSIDAQWSVLDLILRNTPDRRDHEKDRIDKSVWWDEVTGAVTELPKDGVVWHFYPLAMIGNLRTLSSAACSSCGLDLDFLGEYQDDPILEDDFTSGANELGVDVAFLKAFKEVESSGRGFVEVCGQCKRLVPKILFERHFFHRLSSGKYSYDHPDISWMAGYYGRGGVYISDRKALVDLSGVSHEVTYWRSFNRRRDSARETEKRRGNELFDNGTFLRPRDAYLSGLEGYKRFLKALAFDSESAIMSCSWGAFQIMGEYFRLLGFETPVAFARAMSKSEKEHFKALIQYLKNVSPHVVRAMKRLDFAGVAKGYNGPNYHENEYDRKLREAYEKFKD